MPEVNLSIHENAASLGVSEEDIQKFANYVHAGINAWINAGAILISMRERDPNVFERIMTKYPGISYDILKTFENIGLKRIYPYLLLDNCPGSRKVMQLKFEDQVRFYSAKFDVVSISNGKFVTEKKRLQQLTSFDVDRIFDGERLRTAEEQEREWHSFVAPRKIGIPFRQSRQPRRSDGEKILDDLERRPERIQLKDQPGAQPVAMVADADGHSELVGSVEFDFDAIDGGPKEDRPTELAATALRRLLEWCWLTDMDHVRNKDAALLRFAAMCCVIQPDAMAGMNYEEIGQMFGVTKQAVGKYISQFRDEFGGLDFLRTRNTEARDKMAEKMTQSHKERNDRC